MILWYNVLCYTVLYYTYTTASVFRRRHSRSGRGARGRRAGRRGAASRWGSGTPWHPFVQRVLAKAALTFPTNVIPSRLLAGAILVLRTPRDPRVERLRRLPLSLNVCSEKIEALTSSIIFNTFISFQTQLHLHGQKHMIPFGPLVPGGRASPEGNGGSGSGRAPEFPAATSRIGRTRCRALP